MDGLPLPAGSRDHNYYPWRCGHLRDRDIFVVKNRLGDPGPWARVIMRRAPDSARSLLGRDADGAQSWRAWRRKFWFFHVTVAMIFRKPNTFLTGVFIVIPDIPPLFWEVWSKSLDFSPYPLLGGGGGGGWKQECGDKIEYPGWLRSGSVASASGAEIDYLRIMMQRQCKDYETRTVGGVRGRVDDETLNLLLLHRLPTMAS